jgi:hypothetical protein
MAVFLRWNPSRIKAGWAMVTMSSRPKEIATSSGTAA